MREHCTVHGRGILSTFVHEAAVQGAREQRQRRSKVG